MVVVSMMPWHAAWSKVKAAHDRMNKVSGRTRRRPGHRSPFEKAGVVERAELVCDRSSELAALAGPPDIGDLAIDLLRAADHDETILRHAMRIGRVRMERESANDSTRGGVRLLEAVIAFLSIRPRADEAGSTADGRDQRCWRAPGMPLQVGDRVVVHDSSRAEFAFVPGVVATVNRLKATDGVGVCVATSDGVEAILWSARLTVHLNPWDADWGP
jgi:hypothetical protein